MEDMDMPGLGVMPVEVNGEEMLMTEVTHGSHGSHGLFGIMGSGFQPEQAGLIVDPATQAPVGVSHPQGRTDSNSETAGKWLPCKRSTRDAAEVEPSDRRGQNVCPDNSTYDLHMTHFHLTNDSCLLHWASWTPSARLIQGSCRTKHFSPLVRPQTQRNGIFHGVSVPEGTHQNLSPRKYPKGLSTIGITHHLCLKKLINHQRL